MGRGGVEGTSTAEVLKVHAVVLPITILVFLPRVTDLKKSMQPVTTAIINSSLHAPMFLFSKGSLKRTVHFLVNPGKNCITEQIPLIRY